MKQKTVLITGSTSGIGLELTKLFAKDYYQLVLVARNEKKLKEQKENYLETNQIHIISEDLSSTKSVDKITTYLNKNNISPDILINNAGFGSFGYFHKEDPQHITDMIQLNITSLTLLTHAITPRMVAQKSGKILNVASTAAFLPGPLMAIYYATKHYVLAFSESLTNELKDFNITVTTLCPGPTKTNFHAAANLKHSKLFSSAQIMTAKNVATQAYHALHRGKAIIVPGFSNKIFTFLPRLFPRQFTTWMVRKFQNFK